ncbi:haloacetate dehalogenase H-1 [Fusarium agapanthi]|uniref:Haloacetate dehalogenase H-1 n=1 Tax=Fusarium agapanthi TaxID=1803897 RepID=A0A9P5AWE3_9HYPO|nr:haloacetate dehalogenase H-1 [Fusarium agapanthi]
MPSISVSAVSFIIKWFLSNKAAQEDEEATRQNIQETYIRPQDHRPPSSLGSNITIERVDVQEWPLYRISTTNSQTKTPLLYCAVDHPEALRLAEIDFWLGVTGLRISGKIFAGDLPIQHPLVSPLYGDMENLPPLLMFGGPRDLLCADARRLKSKLLGKDMDEAPVGSVETDRLVYAEKEEMAKLSVAKLTIQYYQVTSESPFGKAHKPKVVKLSTKMRFFQLAFASLASVVAATSSFDTWAHGRVALQDVSIHFRYAGSGPPLLLVHGNPQHSLTWQFIGPILAQNYTIIAPDNRGAGDSSVPPDGNYTAAASAEDLKGVLDFLNITSAYVFAHDKGVGMATALAIKYPDLVKRLALAEYVLPGFTYEQSSNPAPFWDLYQNWQLAFFQVPDLAEFLMSGKEKQFLQWYFYHGSYSGVESFSEETVNRYTSSISKPGFLRAMLGPFSSSTVYQDGNFFKAALNESRLSVPLLGMGGEASLGLKAVLKQTFEPVSSELEIDVIPKAGHWVADENPQWTAKRVAKFFGEDNDSLSKVDLGYLDDLVTLDVGFYGTRRNLALGTQ